MTRAQLLTLLAMLSAVAGALAAIWLWDWRWLATGAGLFLVLGVASGVTTGRTS